MGLDRKTIESHLRILEELMLVHLHPAWHRAISSRQIKTPKVYVTDVGMLTSLIGANEERIKRDDALAGRTFETFAAMELVRLASWSEAAPQVMHYRDRDQREVDVILERPDGDLVGVEVKAAATVGPRDFAGLRHLRDRLGEALRSGIVLYTGRAALPFGDRLWALPLSTLWS
jgi:predicted AAA+ superfamily ATPase